MKKVITCIMIVFLVLGLYSISINASNTVNNTSNNTVVQGEEITTGIYKVKDKELKSMEDYKAAYGSDSYGLAAYILNKIRIFSIPVCFVGIALSAIHQYVLGIRKLDVRDKGFHFMIATITVGVICQVLPLVFAIVVKGWRG